MNDIGLWSALGILLIDKALSWFGRNNNKLQEALDANTVALVRLDSTIKYIELRIEKLEKE